PWLTTKSNPLWSSCCKSSVFTFARRKRLSSPIRLCAGNSDAARARAFGLDDLTGGERRIERRRDLVQRALRRMQSRKQARVGGSGREPHSGAWTQLATERAPRRRRPSISRRSRSPTQCPLLGDMRTCRRELRTSEIDPYVWSGCAGRPAEGRRWKSVTMQGLASHTGPESC